VNEDVFMFMAVSRLLIFRKRNVSNKRCRENQNTHFMFSDFFTKIVSFMRKCRRIWWRQRRKDADNTEPARGVLDK
jgi:hypothetical protein